MKSPLEVTAEVGRLLGRTWAQEMTAAAADTDHASAEAQGAGTGRVAWPYTVALGKVSSAQLASRFGDFLHELDQLQRWAAQHDVEIVWDERRVAGTPQRVPTHVRVASLAHAATIAGDGWPDRLERARQRAAVLRARFPHAATPTTLTAVHPLSDLDFDLLCRAADWFATHDASGLTPRQIPIEGLHAKWLNTRHGLVRDLSGKPDLGLLPAHPTRLHFTYLDPAHRAGGGRVHDSATVGDAVTLAYEPRVVVISENKDTAIHFPPVPGGVAVEGVGKGGRTAAAFDWLVRADIVVYWGDMDADGLEILDGFRAAGVPARSILMDPEAYETWERYGTNSYPNGREIGSRSPAAVPRLTADEAALYARLCDPGWTRHRRIEQERIPLAVATEALELAIEQAGAAGHIGALPAADTKLAPGPPGAVAGGVPALG